MKNYFKELNDIIELGSHEEEKESLFSYGESFKKLKVEDFNDDYGLIAYLFAEPKKKIYRALVGRDNCIIVGGWGSGKTHLLKYPSLGSQFADIGKDGVRKSDFIGIYAYPKVGSGYFRPFVLPDGDFKEGGEVLFGHWFNLLILENLLRSLILGQKKRIWTITQEEEYLISKKIMSKFTSLRGIVLVWGKVSERGRKEVKERYHIHDFYRWRISSMT